MARRSAGNRAWTITKEAASHDEVLVEKAIQVCIEKNLGTIDLSNSNLSSLPRGIMDTKHLTFFRNNEITSGIQLFLSFNPIRLLPSYVFDLTNLTILSLRNNELGELPHLVGNLVNLQELSLSGNQLRWLPAEILTLPKLTRLSAVNNPFITDPAHYTPAQPNRRIPPLAELCLRKVLNKKLPTKDRLPQPLLDILEKPPRKCYHCKSLMSSPYLTQLKIQEFLQCHTPFEFAFCSHACQLATTDPS